MSFKPIFHHIIGDSIGYCWNLALQKVLTEGRDYGITSGSLDYEGNFRRTLSIIIEMHKPSMRPLAVYIPEHLSTVPAPTTEEKIQEYMAQLVTSDKAEGEHYTYGEDLSWEIEAVIKYYKKYGFGTACCYMSVGRPESFFNYNWDVDFCGNIIATERVTGKLIFNRYLTNVWNKNPDVEVSTQCLRGIDTWIENNKLHFACYFRSNDLWGAFPQNYGGLQLVKEYMAESIGVEDGPLIAISKDLHIYNGEGMDFALSVIGKTREEVGLPVKKNDE